MIERQRSKRVTNIPVVMARDLIPAPVVICERACPGHIRDISRRARRAENNERAQLAEGVHNRYKTAGTRPEDFDLIENYITGQAELRALRELYDGNVEMEQFELLIPKYRLIAFRALHKKATRAGVSAEVFVLRLDLVKDAETFGTDTTFFDDPKVEEVVTVFDEPKKKEEQPKRRIAQSMIGSTEWQMPKNMTPPEYQRRIEWKGKLRGNVKLQQWLIAKKQKAYADESARRYAEQSAKREAKTNRKHEMLFAANVQTLGGILRGKNLLLHNVTNPVEPLHVRPSRRCNFPTLRGGCDLPEVTTRGRMFDVFDTGRTRYYGAVHTEHAYAPDKEVIDWTKEEPYFPKNRDEE